MSKAIRRKPILVGILAGLTAVTAQAQFSIEEIVVTARRVSESLQDVPISMTVFTQKELEQRNITIAKDLAIYTPSLSVDQRYGPEKASFSMRGFNQDYNTAPTVGVYFAEVVGVRAQGGTTSGNTVGAGAFMDLENVQVLKGPQGTLFGRNTNGGAILLVPRKPTDAFEGYIEASAGNYDMRRLQAAVNIPVTDNFRLRFAVDDHDRDGYMINRSGIGTKDYNDRNYTAFRASAVWDITPNLENYTIFHNSNSNSNGFASRIVNCDRSVAPNAMGAIDLTGMVTMAACDQLDRQTQRGDGKLDVETNLTNPFVKLKQWQIINTTTWEISENLTLKNILSYGEFEEKAHFDLYTSNFVVPASVNGLNFGENAPFIPVTPGTPFNLIDLDYRPGQAQAQQKTWTEELQLQGQGFDGKLSYVVGGYLEFSKPNGYNAGRTAQFTNCDRPKNLNCDWVLPLAGSISQSTNEFDFQNHGVFAQGTWSFTEQWALTAGIRYTYDEIEGYDQSVSIRPLPFQSGPLTYTCNDVFRMPGMDATDPSVCGKTIKQKSEEPTWLINLDYKPNANTLLYAKYARGYRQGGVNFTNPGIETWQPEKVDNYEVGAKLTFDGAIPGYVNIAAFYNDYQDQQVFGALVTDRVNHPQVIGGNAIVNAGKSKIAGIEVDASALFFDRLRLSLAYAYLDTELKEINTGSINLAGTPFLAIHPKASAGDPLNLAPEHKFTLTASYLLPVSESVGDISVGATYIYTDEQLVDGSAVHPVSHIPSTELVNLNFDWHRIMGSPFDLSLFATNVTNEEYPVSSGGGWNSFGFGDLLYGEPRMYGARLRYNFGG